MGFFLPIKSLPNLLLGVLCLPGDQSHPFVQPTINLLACCICWTGLLGRGVFPPWNEGSNFGSYKSVSDTEKRHVVARWKEVGVSDMWDERLGGTNIQLQNK